MAAKSGEKTQKVPERRNVLRSFGKTRVLIALALVIVYAGAATYYVMSETSVRGLSVKVYSISRFCTVETGSSTEVVNYLVGASVWSTTSLQTSLNNVKFALSVDGVEIGVLNQTSASFSPGGGVPYSLTFQDPSVSPALLPRT